MTNLSAMEDEQLVRIRDQVTEFGTDEDGFTIVGNPDRISKAQWKVLRNLAKKDFVELKRGGKSLQYEKGMLLAKLKDEPENGA